MFTNISWTNYIIVIILILAIYYLFIGIRFYYHELKNFVGKRKFQLHPAHNELSHGPGNMDNNGEDERVHSEPLQAQNSFGGTPDDAFQEVEHLIGRLKEVIEEASRKKYIKQEFLQYLKLILKEYPEIKNSPFQPAINELIISECERYGSIMLSENEVVMLWNDV